jgi:hypothetical protein
LDSSEVEHHVEAMSVEVAKSSLSTKMDTVDCVSRFQSYCHCVIPYHLIFAPIAQLAEHRTCNAGVECSIHSRCSINYKRGRIMAKCKKIIFCKNCKIQLNDRHSIYCSNQCQIQYQYDTYIERWKSGLENALRGKYQLSLHIKKYIFQKYNNKCCKCGWSELNIYSNNIPLEIEHKDGNYLNNKEENLELLCPNCHSLTSTYRNLNKGNGRKERRKYSL